VTEDTQELAPGQKSWRHDLGERPKLVDVKKPYAAVWKNSGTAADVTKACEYSMKTNPGTGIVLVYPVTEKDPLGRARKDVLAGHKAHSTKLVDAPSFRPAKISKILPAAMTAGAINKELDKLDERNSILGQMMIDAGRGFERPSEYLKQDDHLSSELRHISDRRTSLRIEIESRYGPGAPRRLPIGRKTKFGPLVHAVKRKNCTLGTEQRQSRVKKRRESVVAVGYALNPEGHPAKKVLRTCPGRSRT